MTARGLTYQPIFGYQETDKDEEEEKDGSNEHQKNLNSQDNFLSSHHIVAHMEMLWNQESEILDLVYGTYDIKTKTRVSNPSIFFQQVIPVSLFFLCN